MIFLFPRLPTKPSIRKEWLKALGGTEDPITRTYVCSMHFGPDNYSQTVKRRCLLPSAIPSLDMPVSNPIPFYHERTPVPLPTPGNLHDHSYTVSPGTTKRKLERALGIEKIKKRKAQMDNIKKSIKIQSLKDLKSTMQDHGMEDEAIQSTFDSVHGNAYVILCEQVYYEHVGSKSGS
ncbi:THAP domain-containing protein 1-like [Strongylocentrotus purpuratus]|uniref:THAP-type domain-containing protein n=1 Tax=Strongylocentrotus purpuratus TaxID=7668 RepID=A0A7M7PEJ8_STRPU|nr:THAP domain-containing protein 1-like [Strongylocentrotus purpuratus]XP_030849490.1 THAP domain-containing protein 1-like [Strongylocentrotus purpuratus]